ncbi:MAG: aldehyde dehydrogenase [Nitrososphaerota archaeon]
MRALLLAGERRTGERSLTVINPSTGEELERVAAAGREEVREAAEAARRAQVTWAALPLRERAKVLVRTAALVEARAEELARLLALEAGKPIRDARVEVLRAVSVFRLSAEEARFVLEGKVHRVDAYEYPPGNEQRFVMELREPLGVVAAILPFNFPANSFAHKVAPTLAAGNAVLVKPASATPLTALELGALLYEAGLPRGVLSVLPGRGGEVGEELLASDAVDAITFTGSTAVGLQLASRAALRGKRLLMELGGSDPIIILPDADLEKAVSTAVRARFEYAGQNCNAGKRILVHEALYARFSSAYAERARALRVGDPLDEMSEVGPLISREALASLEDYLSDALAKGARLAAGGGRLEGRGFYFAPTVLTDVPGEARAMKEEVFGPLAPLTSFSSEDEALALAGQSEYGLQAAIFTADIRKALRLAAALRVGAVMINDSTRLRWDALPFGGAKKSGLGGREGVRSTIYHLTEPKLISINLGGGP